MDDEEESKKQAEKFKRKKSEKGQKAKDDDAKEDKSAPKTRARTTKRQTDGNAPSSADQQKSKSAGAKKNKKKQEEGEEGDQESGEEAKGEDLESGGKSSPFKLHHAAAKRAARKSRQPAGTSLKGDKCKVKRKLDFDAADQEEDVAPKTGRQARPLDARAMQLWDTQLYYPCENLSTTT